MQSLVKRYFVKVADHPVFLRVMQWNILCDALAFNSFDRVPDELVMWSYREPLIIQHIIDQDADIVCLEEVDKFNELMAKLGQTYAGKCIMKPDGVMGCAILWKHGKVELDGEVQSRSLLDEQGKQQNQIVVYGRFKKDGKHFNVVCTHLKAKRGFEDLRKCQADQCAALLADSKELTVVCGDFNDEPNSLCYQSMKGYDSLFARVLDGSEPEFTTFKYRESSGMTKRTIDYVFTRGVPTKVAGFLSMPAESEIDQHMANPCKDHPSDHYSLVFDICAE